MELTIEIDNIEYSKIPLRNINNKIIDYAIIDKNDYENTVKYSWYFTEKRVTGTINGITMQMSHFIHGKIYDKKTVVDHINHNTLDNRRINLRYANKKQNGQNKDKKENSSSKYYGVFLHKNKKWWSKSNTTYLGIYENEIDAAIIYDKFVLINYGKYAMTNGLVRYEEVINMTNDDLLIPKPERKYPKNIFYNEKKKIYDVFIVYKNKKYRQSTINYEKALEIKENFLNEIEIIKKEEILQHNNKKIIRNQNNDAIIELFTKKGKYLATIIVDDDLWHNISSYSLGLNDGYPYIHQKFMRLSRYLMNAPDDLMVDHIDNNPYNNKISNLRLATDAQNSYNKIINKSVNNTSLFKGVSKSIYKKTNKISYEAKIKKNYLVYHLGNYDIEVIAAIAYNLKAIELFGEFANINKLSIDTDKYDEYVTMINSKWLNYKEKWAKLENQKIPNIKKEKFMGVSKNGNNYASRICKNNDTYHIGTYKTAVEAAIAYNLKYIELYGNEADKRKLNIINIEDKLYKKYKKNILDGQIKKSKKI